MKTHWVGPDEELRALLRGPDAYAGWQAYMSNCTDYIEHFGPYLLDVILMQRNSAKQGSGDDSAL